MADRIDIKRPGNLHCAIKDPTLARNFNGRWFSGLRQCGNRRSYAGHLGLFLVHGFQPRCSQFVHGKKAGLLTGVEWKNESFSNGLAKP